MVDNGENILVEFDYQNISVIDPNKVVDENGMARERLVNQEDLVYYANLECSVLPRTKLAIGVPLEDSVRTISVGKINFLNPGEHKFLEEIYVDEITGKDSLQGKGLNQQKIDVINSNSDDYFYRQSTISNGNPGATDTGMLGITQINISYGTDFLPVIDITLEDVKGRALFESGSNSPYAAFFQLPYPLFYLTIKGYLGKAVRLPLMLQTFTASFDPSSANFRIQLRMYTYKYTILSHINWQAMMSTPLMFQSAIETVPQTTTGNGNKNDKVVDGWSSKGYSKIKELYAEYKSKGLIADNFPEITIQELQINLNTFLKNIIDNYPKTNLDVLNSLSDYSKVIDRYEQEVYLFSGVDSWYGKYLDTKNPFVTFPPTGQKDGYVLYQFKEEYKSSQKQQEALTELSGIVKRNNELLRGNTVLGDGKPNSIPVDIFVDLQKNTSTFYYNTDVSNIDINKTYSQRNGKEITFTATTAVQNQIRTQFDSSPKFFFKGTASFIDKTTTIRENYQTKKQAIEEQLSKDLILNISKSASEGGIGFSPTIRNVLAVFFAQGEAFLRLLDEVHAKAWDLRDDTIRKAAVLSTSSGANSVDLKDLTVAETPIYPWPQVIVENNLKEGERYELKYPGDTSIATKIRAYQPEIWPEVEFVEDFIKATYERKVPEKFPTDTNNQQLKPNRLSFNAIEFPINNQVYQNVEEVKFFYEIYERLLVNSFYSKLSRDSNKLFNMTEYYSEAEVLNMLESLGDDNPFLTKKLKEYNLNSGIFLPFLRHISNGGTGESWQNYIRGEFNTPYIKNDINTSFNLYNQDILTNEKSQPLLSLKDNSYAKEYFGNANIVEDFDFTDTYPITNLGWINDYLADGSNIQKREDAFKTNQVLEYNTTIKSITNYDDTVDSKDKQPVTTFNYKSNNSGTFNQTIILADLKTFYQTRTINNQYTTEGNISYYDYDNKLVSEQTTSILNTPYFINAIQKGVYDFRYTNNLYPFKSASYLFLNSLPLATLREKYKEDNDGSSSDLNYIISTYKKYGGIHKIPYAWVLKYGSIWHRYKTWVEDEVDILDDVWTDFNYSDNYDPQNNDITKTYSLIIDGLPQDIVLQDTVVNGLVEQTRMNTGFYPKLIDDFNIFFQGRRVFETQVQITGTATILGNTLTVTNVSGNDLFDGAILSGNGITLGTTITGQTSGTIGGVGVYGINVSQTATTAVSFYVTNPPAQSYSNSEIQTVLNDDILYLKSAAGSTINKLPGFDTGNLNRTLSLKSWSCFVTSLDGNNIYPMPSFGSSVNQTNDECFGSNGNLATEVVDNPAVYNGSVRLFWKAPNYGYFDNDKLSKPSPNSYLKQIKNDESIQQAFSINGVTSEYSKISEMFTTFEKGILDIMENEFLNFSRSVYDYNTNIKSTLGNETTSEITNNNFQSLMRSLMKVPKPQDNINGSVVINEIQESQINNFKQVLGSFMDYKVTMKYGNPSNFDKKLFYTYSNQILIDPYVFQGYNIGSPNSLPSAGGTITLAQSKTQNPETWKTLETYVGFSEIPELIYSDNGSYITDFFLDMNIEFTENSIKTLSPLIKIYATQKLEDNNFNLTKFKTLMDDYITKSNTYINTLLDLEMTRLRKELPDVNINQTNTKVRADYEGDQTRYELWELFKSINDTWISGTDFKNKTLFEDVLLMDRASRDVGQQIYVDIFKLKTLIDSSLVKNNMLDIVQTILTENNFVNFVIPAFANFYNVRDVSKNAVPRPEGTLEFANTLFGTYLNVDYRETGAKFVCLYANKPSEHLALNDNVDYRYRDDAFDLRRATDNPLLENQENKTDWGTSNKVVGFNVDIGPQNQQIFKQIDVSQDPGLPTTESLEVLNQMANQDRNRGSYTQSVSLYNLYKNRSYKCSVDMMGNALIQPMMYFNLRNVPLFSGPYMILKVTHRISNNGFDTTFEGQRQPFYSIPKIESFIQSISTKILKDIQERIKQNEETNTQQVNTLSQTATKLDNISETNTTPNVNQACSASLNGTYKNYTSLENLVSVSINKKDASDTITKLVIADGRYNNGDDSQILSAFIYSIMTVATKPSEIFKTYGNNYGLIPLNTNYGDSALLFENNYYCNSKNIPLAVFSSFDQFVKFMIAKYGPQLGTIKNYTSTNNNTFDETKYGRAFAQFYMDNYPTNEGQSLFDTLIEENKGPLEKLFGKSYTDYVSSQKQYPSQPSVSLPKPAKPNPVYNGNQLVQMVISISSSVGKWNINEAEIIFSKIPEGCNATIGVKINVSTFIATNKQSFTMTAQDLLNTLGCTQQGLYNVQFNVTSVPVLEDGITIDTTRSSVPQTYVISPIL